MGLGRRWRRICRIGDIIRALRYSMQQSTTSLLPTSQDTLERCLRCHSRASTNGCIESGTNYKANDWELVRSGKRGMDDGAVGRTR